MELLRQQQQAINKLERLKVGALFMQPGTGKTRAAYNLATRISGIDLVLWLTPFQTKSNLRDEIEKCGGMKNIDIVGIETISSSDKEYLRLYNLVSTKNVFIVCDESIKIKNHDAIRTKRIIELGRKCKYKLMLNGTPITRNLLDIWAQFDFLSPAILNMSMAEFKATFCETVKITKRINGMRPVSREFIAKYHNVDYLYSLISPYVFECDLELSITKKHEVVRYELDDECMEGYQEMKAKYLDNEMLIKMNNNIFIEMTQKMQHSYCCTESKFKALADILAQHDKSRCIVYTKYIASYKEVVKRFPDICVLSYGKHSVGLNLQHNNVTIYFDKTFDYMQMTQSEFRTYRTGQNEDCIYYRLTGNVGLEKMIDDNIDKKQNLLDYFKKVGIDQIKTEI